MNLADDVGHHLSIYDKTQVHIRRSLRNHIDLAVGKRGECLLQQTFQIYDILPDHGNLGLVPVHLHVGESRKLLRDLVYIL